MAIYAIGDVQGCFDELRRLLDAIDFDSSRDRLWFTGDLVNRGTQSLETLRFVKGLADGAVMVLGNHDLHLLAISAKHAKLHKRDSLDDVLAAPDRDELIDWLRHRPLLHAESGYCLIHAGVPPQWDLVQAQRCAAEVEVILRGPAYRELYRHMYGDNPNFWCEDLRGWDRIRFITNCFTRMRFCDREGRLDLKQKGPPGSQPTHLLPWFGAPGRKSASSRILFGHWSTLKFYSGCNTYCLDTGCLWGGQLTALRLGEEPVKISIDCPRTRNPDD